MTTATEPARKGGWIQTYSGRKFWPLDPRAVEVNIFDIAWALSNLCRFTGHTQSFYSVAQHSVLASQIVPKGSALAALLHDAAEAYMGDIARPWKRFLYIRTSAVMDRVYETLKDVEHQLLDVILKRFYVSPRSERDIWEPVEKADEVLLVTEARDFMSPLADGWRHSTENGCYALHSRIEPLEPVQAYQAFVNRFLELGGVPL